MGTAWRPSQWWVELGGEGSGDGVAAVAVGIDPAALEGATRSLEGRLQELLLVGLTADDASWALWLLLLEEWCLAQRLAVRLTNRIRRAVVDCCVLNPTPA